MKYLKFTPDLVTGRLSEDDAKRYFSRFGWFAFAFLIILTVAQSALAVAVRTFAPNFFNSYLFSEILSVIPLYAVAFPLSLMILAPLPTVTPVKEKMRVRDFLAALCICEALMMLGNYISNILLIAVQSTLGAAPSNPVADSVASQPLWATFLFTVILAPILEEIFFRGMICKKLLITGEAYAVVLSSAFFALCHGNFFQLFYAFAIGCFFGFIYVKTGKLLYTVVMHMVVNFLGTVVVMWVFDISNVEQMLEENFMLNGENILGFMVFLWYELLILGVSGLGLFLLIKHKNRIKFDSGLLPPPEKKGVSCVLLNFGIAAAIAIFSLTFIASLAL